jgi:hypothetical protein
MKCSLVLDHPSRNGCIPSNGSWPQPISPPPPPPPMWVCIGTPAAPNIWRKFCLTLPRYRHLGEEGGGSRHENGEGRTHECHCEKLSPAAPRQGGAGAGRRRSRSEANRAISEVRPGMQARHVVDSRLPRRPVLSSKVPQLLAMTSCFFGLCPSASFVVKRSNLANLCNLWIGTGRRPPAGRPTPFPLPIFSLEANFEKG